MLHAIIDVGSNTVRMAIYRIEGGTFDLLLKRKHTVGLAAYLEHGCLVREGIEKTVKILRGFRSYIETFDIRSVHAFATAALRSATNSRAACEEIARRTGVRIRIISGDEEAAYDFVGAVGSIPYPDGIMMDIGGGSTEIVSYARRRMQARYSLPLGSLALRRAHVKDLLPTREECAEMERAVREVLAGAPEVCALRSSHILGIGGVLNSASRLHELLHRDAEPRLLRVDALPALIEMFSTALPLDEERAVLLLRAAPDRLHNIVPGMIIARVLAETFAAADIFYSDSGVREGYIRKEIIGDTEP